MPDADIAVIGAGPAGLSAAIYASRYGFRTVVLDPLGSGGQLMYIDELENYPGFRPASGFGLSAAMEEQAESSGAVIRFSNASSVRRKGRNLLISTENGDIESKTLIVAAGARHRTLGIPGEKEYLGKGVSYCATCDGAFFRERKAIIVGGGDTALTDAVYLSRICSSVTIIHRRPEFRAQRILQERAASRENISTIMNAEIQEITGVKGSVTGVILNDGRKLDTDAVFILAGMIPNTEFLSGMLALQDGYIITDERMRTSEDGIFAAGDIRTSILRQAITAAADGAIAANSAAAYLESLS